jgi:manganese efflux pump family protein
MPWTEILVVAVALSLDACAVALAASTSGRIAGKRAVFRLSFHFGLFQFLMPVIGWALGATLAPVIGGVDHWIAFGLLAFVGGRMIRTGIRPEHEAAAVDPSRGLVLVLLAIATSIDALAVGLSLGMLHVRIWLPSLAIGIITAGMTVLAIAGGARVGRWLGHRAQVAGGVILLLIGLKILVSHLAGQA